MARKRNHQPHRRPHTRQPSPKRDDAFADQPLIQEVRAALREEDPCGLLGIASSVIAVSTPRVNPLVPTPAPTFTFAEFIESLIGSPFTETTALLTALDFLNPDESLRSEIRAELGARRHPLPLWLRGLGEARVEQSVLQLADNLGDNTDYFITVTIPGADPISLVVLVDHQLGGAVADAFLVPLPGEDLLLNYRAEITSAVTVSRPDSADTRAVLEFGLALEHMMVPPVETESWPQCRAAMEWVLRLMPADGIVPHQHEWTDEERETLVDAVLTSPEARTFMRTVGKRDAPSLFSSLINVALDRGTGDPLLWSARGAHNALHWAANKVIAERSYLALFPDALSVLIAYGHRVRGVAEADTALVMGQYAELCQIYDEWLDDGPTGSAGLLADSLANALGLDDLSSDEVAGLVAELGPEGITTLLGTLQSGQDRRRDELRRAVGGADALAALSADPLPVEPLDLTGVPEDIHERVREWAELLDGFAVHLGDDELGTAQRRFLAICARTDPAIFRRKASVDRGAAAVAWLVGKANGVVAFYANGPGVAVNELAAWFGLTGSLSQRAEPLLRAVGGSREEYSGEVFLGSAAMLVSARRLALIDVRDYLDGEVP